MIPATSTRNYRALSMIGESRGTIQGDRKGRSPIMASIEQRVRARATTWRVVWREAGRRQQVTFADAGQAARFAHLVEGSGNRWPAGWTKPVAAAPIHGLTFGQWADRAINSRRRANARTKADYRRDLVRHFGALAPIPLAELDREHVDAWVDVLRAGGLADKTVRNLHGFGASLIVDALNHRPPLTDHNPFARLADAPGVRVEEMVFLTREEFGLLARHVREEYAPLIRWLVGTGMRYGEATALTVRDVDVLGRRKTGTVTKAWKRTGPTEYVIGEPKTPRSRRTIGLSDELLELLIPLIAGKRGGDLLFSLNGLRLPHSEVYKRAWAPAVARARVCEAHYEPQRTRRSATERPRIPAPCDCPGVLDKTPRIHDLRHTHASWLIADGLPLPAISRRLGHSSIQITIDRYGHLDPSLDDAINAAVDRALAPR